MAAARPVFLKKSPNICITPFVHRGAVKISSSVIAVAYHVVDYNSQHRTYQCAFDEIVIVVIIVVVVIAAVIIGRGRSRLRRDRPRRRWLLRGWMRRDCVRDRSRCRAGLVRRRLMRPWLVSRFLRPRGAWFIDPGLVTRLLRPRSTGLIDSRLISGLLRPRCTWSIDSWFVSRLLHRWGAWLVCPRSVPRFLRSGLSRFIDIRLVYGLLLCRFTGRLRARLVLLRRSLLCGLLRLRLAARALRRLLSWFLFPRRLSRCCVGQRRTGRHRYSNQQRRRPSDFFKKAAVHINHSSCSVASS